MPLYDFCGEHLVCVRLRPADQDAAAGSVDDVRRPIGQIRPAWPEVAVTLLGDSGFCRDELMTGCEENKVGYVLGFARNSRLENFPAPQMDKARSEQTATGKPARVFAEFQYWTANKTSSRVRRVMGKAGVLGDKENPRFVVASLAGAEWALKALYEVLYCAPGEMEKRIKEQPVC